MIKPFSSSELTQLYQDWQLAPYMKLPPKSTIVVAGAYQGKLIRLLTEMFPDYAHIIGFEPQSWAYKECLKNTNHLSRVTIHNYGLLADAGNVDLHMGEWGTDACSVLTQDREQGSGMFNDAYLALVSYHIDLFVMNLEGYEYILLPYMIEKKITNWIDQLAVQFHVKYQTSNSPQIFETMDKIFTRAVDQYPKWVLWSRE